MSNLDRLRGKEKQDKKLKTVEMEEEMPEMQIQPKEEQMHVELFPDKSGRTTRIGTQLEHHITEDLIRCLRRNAYIFTSSTKDMTCIDPGVTMHILNVDHRVKPIKQKRRHFGLKKDKILQEVQKLLEAEQVREIQFPEWLSNDILVPSLLKNGECASTLEI